MINFHNSKDHMIYWLLDRQVYKAKDGRQLFELSTQELRHLVEEMVYVR
ncbi:Fur-regulated basic protein FbpA [Bacillus sp. Hm123]